MTPYLLMQDVKGVGTYIQSYGCAILWMCNFMDCQVLCTRSDKDGHCEPERRGNLDFIFLTLNNRNAAK